MCNACRRGHNREVKSPIAYRIFSSLLGIAQEGPTIHASHHGGQRKQHNLHMLQYIVIARYFAKIYTQPSIAAPCRRYPAPTCNACTSNTVKSHNATQSVFQLSFQSPPTSSRPQIFLGKFFSLAKPDVRGAPHQDQHAYYHEGRTNTDTATGPSEQM